MKHLLRSRLIFSFFAATLVLFVVLLAAPLASSRSALAAEPDGVDALNVELVGTYDTSTLDRRAVKVFVHEGHAYLIKNAFNSDDPASSRNAVDEVNISNPSNPQRNNTFGIDSNSGVVSGPGMGYTINDIFVRGPIV
jgi:ABC-type microcin C transport system permease subunit YejE